MLVLEAWILTCGDSLVEKCQEECPARVSIARMSCQECPAKVSSKSPCASVKEDCQKRVSSNSVKQECQERVCSKERQERV